MLTNKGRLAKALPTNGKPYGFPVIEKLAEKKTYGYSDLSATLVHPKKSKASNLNSSIIFSIPFVPATSITLNLSVIYLSVRVTLVHEVYFFFLHISVHNPLLSQYVMHQD